MEGIYAGKGGFFFFVFVFFGGMLLWCLCTLYLRAYQATVTAGDAIPISVVASPVVRVMAVDRHEFPPLVDSTERCGSHFVLGHYSSF